MSKIDNIARNTSYLTMALIFQKVISFTYFAILARNLGPENIGKYYLAISFVTIFAIFIDLGMVNVLTREIAKKIDKASNLLGNILTIKLPLLVVSLLAVVLAVNLLGYDSLIKQLVYISCIAMVLDSFTITFYAVARGFHNLKFESIASIIFQLIVISLGITALNHTNDLRIIMLALTVASLFNFTYSFLILNFKLKVKIIPRYDKILIRRIINITLPFAAFAIFQRLYTYFDSVLLSILAGDTYVGLYQVAFKIIIAIQFLPMAFTASLYPAMSSYWVNNKKELGPLLERALNYLIIISIPITVGVIALADKIVLIFKTGYDGAILPLQITMLALVFIFINFPIGSLLNACDKQKKNTINMGIVVAVSIILNIILIPLFQAVGAGIAVVITNILMFVLNSYWIKKIIYYKAKRNIIVFFKTLISSFVMLSVIYILKDKFNFFILVIVSGFTYFTILFTLKGFKVEDIRKICNSFKRN